MVKSTEINIPKRDLRFPRFGSTSPSALLRIICKRRGWSLEETAGELTAAARRLKEMLPTESPAIQERYAAVLSRTFTADVVQSMKEDASRKLLVPELLPVLSYAFRMNEKEYRAFATALRVPEKEEWRYFRNQPHVNGNGSAGQVESSSPLETREGYRKRLRAFFIDHYRHESGEHEGKLHFDRLAQAVGLKKSEPLASLMSYLNHRRPTTSGGMTDDVLEGLVCVLETIHAKKPRKQREKIVGDFRDVFKDFRILEGWREFRVNSARPNTENVGPVKPLSSEQIEAYKRDLRKFFPEFAKDKSLAKTGESPLYLMRLKKATGVRYSAITSLLGQAERSPTADGGMSVSMKRKLVEYLSRHRPEKVEEFVKAFDAFYGAVTGWEVVSSSAKTVSDEPKPEPKPAVAENAVPAEAGSVAREWEKRVSETSRTTPTAEQEDKIKALREMVERQGGLLAESKNLDWYLRRHVLKPKDQSPPER